VRVDFWGCRGSIASAGPQTVRYGGNTASVQVTGDDGTILFLDAGTGIRAPSAMLRGAGRVDVLLTHLHLDHIQGLGFFRPLFEEGTEVHVWGPPSTTQDLRARLTRYLSPPLFPVRIKELPSRVVFHDAPRRWDIGAFRVTSAGILHPDPTLGYRVSEGTRSLAYLSDHEPALGGSSDTRWTSGFELANGVDLLIHDGQYTDVEYAARVGWGHSSVTQAVDFARRVAAKRLALFHHDPNHDDALVDELVREAQALSGGVDVFAAQEGSAVEV
jgi:phosphoribosyl 1,2-cyclic phosphodiesterase